MNIKTDYDIGDAVRVIRGKYKAGVGKITGIALEKKDDYIQVVYTIILTVNGKDSCINRTVEEIRRTTLLPNICCSVCHFCKEIVYECMCKDCFTSIWNSIEDDLYISRKSIAELKETLFASDDMIVDKEEYLSEICMLLMKVRNYEYKLSNMRNIKKSIQC